MKELVIVKQANFAIGSFELGGKNLKLFYHVVIMSSRLL